MTQPSTSDIRLYSKISQSIENMSLDAEEMSDYSNLYSRLCELKSEMESLYPNISLLRIDVMQSEESTNMKKEIMLDLNGL